MSLLSFLYVVLLWLELVAATAGAARSLKPVPKAFDLRPRSVSFEPKPFANDLLFADEGSASPFAALMTFRPRLPSVVLDHLSHHFKKVSCDESTLELTFFASDVADNAYQTWSNHSDFLLVTSLGESLQGQSHKAYVVSAVHADATGLSLSVSPTEFREVVENMQVKFGEGVFHKNVHAGLRRRTPHVDHFERRQFGSLASAAVSAIAGPSSSVFSSKVSALASSSASPGTVAIGLTNPPATNAPISPSLPYPSPASASSSVGSATVASASVQATYRNQPILPPGGSFKDQLIGQLLFPGGIQLSCVDCSFDGIFELSDGNFAVNLNTADMLSGFVDFALPDGFKAHVSLELSFQPGAQLEFVAQFPPIPIPFLAIPIVGAGAIGAYVIPEVVMGVTLDSEIDFFAGFDVSIPKGSVIHFDIGNPDSSYSKGFANAEVDALPFNVHATPPALTFYAGLQPHLQLGFAFGAPGLSLDGGVGAYFDTPKLNVTVAQVHGTNASCDPVGAGKGVGHALYNILPSVDLDVGIYANAQLHAGPFSQGIGASTMLESTAFPLPTACLDFSKKGGGLVPARGAGARVGRGGATPLLAGCLVVCASVLALAWL